MPQDIRLTFTNSSGISEDISELADINDSSVVLNIAGIQNEDEGLYTVTASNPAGSDSSTITFEVEGNICNILQQLFFFHHI